MLAKLQLTRRDLNILPQQMAARYLVRINIGSDVYMSAQIVQVHGDVLEVSLGEGDVNVRRKYADVSDAEFTEEEVGMAQRLPIRTMPAPLVFGLGEALALARRECDSTLRLCHI